MENGLVTQENVRTSMQNPVISLDTLYEHQTYEIFAAFYVSAKVWEKRAGFLFREITGDGQEGVKRM